jgi:hypothetical protein
MRACWLPFPTALQGYGCAESGILGAPRTDLDSKCFIAALADWYLTQQPSRVK